MIEARIYKQMGELEKASVSMNNARKMDLADKYLNAKGAKYMIKINKIHEGNRILFSFNKMPRAALDLEQERNSPHEMQCMWYESELGFAYIAKQRMGKAIQMFNYIIQHFNTYYADQV
jgi:N-alpha-acetyltransferase 15/16, NatA auxiliary subunit